MGNLTEDLIIDILIRLPVKSIVRCRCVCDGWYELLTNSNYQKFRQLKLKHDIQTENFFCLEKESENNKLLLTKGNHFYSIDYDPLSLSTTTTSEPLLLSDEIVEVDHPFIKLGGIRILSTCNGLVCASSPTGLSVSIWNPATKEYREITIKWKPITLRRRKVFDIGYGFGYDRQIEDYKCVAVINTESNVSDVEVYTLGLDSWRTVASIPYRIAKGGIPGVFLNGALHWLAQRTANELQVLLSFDMEDEIFAEIHLPDNLGRFDYKVVGALGGCLCMLCSVGKVGFEVWVMQDYGVAESWTKLLTIDQLNAAINIPSFRHLRRAVSLRNGEILLEIQLDGGDGTMFVVYDPKRERARVVKILLEDNNIGLHNLSHRGKKRPLYEMDSYMESLAPVNSGHYVGNRSTQ